MRPWNNFEKNFSELNFSKLYCDRCKQIMNNDVNKNY